VCNDPQHNGCNIEGIHSRIKLVLETYGREKPPAIALGKPPLKHNFLLDWILSLPCLKLSRSKYVRESRFLPDPVIAQARL
jgi:hypothetical protein